MRTISQDSTLGDRWRRRKSSDEMRVNENTVICGDKVILVPYRREHVDRYHEWMKSPELLELTASEPLSLEEEYEMQRKWHLDEDKLTFILLSRPTSLPCCEHPLLAPNQVKQCDMVGDVNMFLPDGLDGDAECEIMIALKEDRRRGYAQEALILFLSYALTTLGITPERLIARIGMDNVPSIKLFQALGFGIEKRIDVFREVEVRWSHDIEQARSASEERSQRAAPLWIADLSGRIGRHDAVT